MSTLFKLLVCLKLFYYFGIVKSFCTVKYPTEIETVPRYEKYIGKYRIPMSNNVTEIHLYEGEILHGFCGSYFSKFYGREGHSSEYSYSIENKIYHLFKHSIELTCSYGKLEYNDQTLGDMTLECKKMDWNIFSTDEIYSWCEKNRNFKTLLLATKLKQDYYIFAGICYNLEEFSLQTITYNLTYSQNRDMEQLIGLTKSNLGDDLWNLKHIRSLEISEQQLQDQITEKSETNSWLNFANYEISSIIQGDSSKRYFNKFNNILNIIWWRNLRLGNWKDFMNTLGNYSHNNSFQLYTGTSDEVKYPNKPNTNLDTILEIENGFRNLTIPAYVWTYLKSTDNRNRDFIVVGYNSPYAEFFSLNNVIFCPDICSEIPWLSEIYPSFRFATAGIMFCCSTDSIRQTNRLHGFPLDILIADKTETAEIDVTTDIAVEMQTDTIIERV